MGLRAASPLTRPGNLPPLTKSKFSGKKTEYDNDTLVAAATLTADRTKMSVVGIPSLKTHCRLTRAGIKSKASHRLCARIARASGIQNPNSAVGVTLTSRNTLHDRRVRVAPAEPGEPHVVHKGRLGKEGALLFPLGQDTNIGFGSLCCNWTASCAAGRLNTLVSGQRHC